MAIRPRDLSREHVQGDVREPAFDFTQTSPTRIMHVFIYRALYVVSREPDIRGRFIRGFSFRHD